MTKKRKFSTLLTGIREERLKKFGIEATLIAFNGLNSGGKSKQIYGIKSFVSGNSEFSAIPIWDTRESKELSAEDIRAKGEYKAELRRDGVIEDSKKTLEVYTKYREIAWRDIIIQKYCRNKGILLLERDALSTLAIHLMLRGIDPRADTAAAIKLAEEIYAPEHIIPPHLSFIIINDVDIVLEKAANEAKMLNRDDYFDKYYITAYRAMHDNKEADPEIMRRWWLTATRTAYIRMGRELPDSYTITIGRDVEHLNPRIRSHISKVCKSLKANFTPRNGSK